MNLPDPAAASPSATPSATPSAPIGQRIDDSYGELTPQEQRAADFILDHLDELAVYNASELARLSGVSKATVSRLFRTLGFSDAQEVRLHARALRSQGVPIGGIGLDHGIAPRGATAGGVTHTKRAPGRVPALNSFAADADSHSDALDRHFAQEQSNLRSVSLLVADGRIAAAAQLVAHARRVVVVGLRNSYPVALHLRQQLVQGLDDVRLAPQPGQSIGEELAGLTGDDVVIVVGFRRRPSGFAQLLDAAELLPVPVVLIADGSAERLAGRARVWLECPVDSVVALDSYAAASSLVTLLASECLGVATRASRTRIASINRLYGSLDELEPAPNP